MLKRQSNGMRELHKKVVVLLVSYLACNCIIEQVSPKRDIELSKTREKWDLESKMPPVVKELIGNKKQFEAKIQSKMKHYSVTEDDPYPYEELLMYVGYKF